jgi:Carboxypeptidase regulatory-like domain
MVLAAQAACFCLDDKMNRLAAKRPMAFQSGRISRATLAAISMLAFGLLNFPGAFGQTPGKNLSGTVKSVSGSPIPNVRVSVKNLASGNSFSAVTGEDGSYKLANLSPGNYEVFASAPGFATVRTSVAMNADRDQVADLVLPSATEQGASSTVRGGRKFSECS